MKPYINKPISKLMSYALRHQSDSLGISLDENGWTDVTLLIKTIKQKHPDFDLEKLKEIVESNDKKRFGFNDDYSKIRANQGHSVNIELELNASTPPYTLYQGTVSKFIASIKEKGLIKGSRQHVHLSENLDTAIQVAQRRGKAIILKVNTHKMIHDGYTFYLSENNVWLIDRVPAEYIVFN